MATAVVSGRVDERVKEEVDRVLQREGKTPGDVIRDMWISIYQTGELPVTQAQEEELREKRQRFAEFLEFVHSLPPAPEWLSNATDEDLRDMIVDEMLEKERRFVGGDRYVSAVD